MNKELKDVLNFLAGLTAIVGTIYALVWVGIELF